MVPSVQPAFSTITITHAMLVDWKPYSSHFRWMKFILLLRRTLTQWWAAVDGGQEKEEEALGKAGMKEWMHMYMAVHQNCKFIVGLNRCLRKGPRFTQQLVNKEVIQVGWRWSWCRRRCRRWCRLRCLSRHLSYLPSARDRRERFSCTWSCRDNINHTATLTLSSKAATFTHSHTHPHSHSHVESVE